MTVKIIQGDCLEVLKTLPDESVNCCVTSPPYWGLRDYGTASWQGGDAGCTHKMGTFQSTKTTLYPGKSQNDKRNFDGMPYKKTCAKCGAKRIDQQLGLERTPEEYVSKMVEVFREVKRVLRGDGTLWLNLGDSYYGSWGNSGRRPELDGTPSEQREKNCEYFNRGGWDERRERPPSSFKLDGIKPKDLVGIPWMVAFALRADGWYLRQDIIWHKPNPMPESVTDRCTKAHEYIFLMSKSQRYFYDAEAIAEPLSENPITRARNNRADKGIVGAADLHGTGIGQSGNGGFNRAGNDNRNRRSVWTVATAPFSGAHFATFPPKLIEPCILAGCPIGGTVLDPFGGSGTVGMVAENNGRNSILIELNPKYVEMAKRRTSQQGIFAINGL
jgi:DNA modification methylase